MVTVGTGEEVEVGWLRVERTSRAEEEELGGQGQLSTCWGLKNIYICVKCFADYVVFYFFSNRTSYWINWRVKSRDSIHFLLSFYVQHNDYIYVSNMHWLRIHQKILQNCVLTKSWKGDWVTYYVQHNDYIYIYNICSESEFTEHLQNCVLSADFNNSYSSAVYRNCNSPK